MLKDLVELAHLCHSKRSRAFIDEAIACYQAGASKGSIVMCWQAVICDYIEKLRELSIDGDNKAGEELETFHNALEFENFTVLQNFEKKLLDNAVEFEFISLLEKEDLARIKKDRNRCAHPNVNCDDEYFSPPPELARSHITMAIESLLRHPPSQGKGALQRLLEYYPSLSMFPKDDNGVIALVKQSPLGRARKSLVRNFVVVVAKHIMNATESELSSNHDNFNKLRILKAYYSLNPGLMDEIFKDTSLHKIIINAFDRNNSVAVFMFLGFVPTLFSKFDNVFVTRVEDFFRNVLFDERIKLSTSQMSRIVRWGREVDDIWRLMDTSKVTEDVVEAMIYASMISEAIVDRAVDLYVSSKSFIQTRDRTVLISQLSAKLTEGHLEKIASATVSNTQISGFHHGGSEAIIAIRQAGVIGEPKFSAILKKYDLELKQNAKSNWQMERIESQAG